MFFIVLDISNVSAEAIIFFLGICIFILKFKLTPFGIYECSGKVATFSIPELNFNLNIAILLRWALITVFYATIHALLILRISIQQARLSFPFILSVTLIYSFILVCLSMLI